MQRGDQEQRYSPVPDWSCQLLAIWIVLILGIVVALALPESANGGQGEAIRYLLPI